jgi:hypothetical protein
MEKDRIFPILGRMGELKMTASEFGAKMKIGRTRCHLLVNGEREFKASEIQRACEILKIEAVDIPRYFFAPDVSKKGNLQEENFQKVNCIGEGVTANA